MTSAGPLGHEVVPVPESIEHTVCPSGLRVVTESMPDARSVCLGFYAAVGSRDESDAEAGASHFLEHLLFKGTETRSARQIATAVDAVGGEMNAFTSRELTAYYVRLPAAHLAEGLDLLCDVVTAPAFRSHEVDAEREVILEELLMSDDDPDDVAGRSLYEAVFPGHPLGRETLGTAETVRSLHRDSIAAFHEHRYCAPGLVVAAAGALEHEQVLAAVADAVGAGDGEAFAHREPPSGHPVPLTVVHRPTEQAHLALGWRSLDAFDGDRYALAIANHVLGGGMASRLFQEVREQRGLAYSVYSSSALYADSGVFTIAAGTGPSRVAELLSVVDAVLEDLVADGITNDEFTTAVGYLTGSTELALEDSGSRMARLGGGLVVRNEVVTVDEHLARLRSVEPADVHRVLRHIFDAPRSVVAVGPFDEDEPVLLAAASWRR